MSSAPSTQICPCTKERSVLPLFSQSCNRQMLFCATLPLSLSYWRVLCSASTCCRELRPRLPSAVERERVVTAPGCRGGNRTCRAVALRRTGPLVRCAPCLLD